MIFSKENEMDWEAGIQRAIEYIEEHLEDEIDYQEVAKCAYSSNYHFQRVFGILSGVTLGEYIRLRRLSCAAQDLLRGEKVLSVAVKYGYESSESFSRAFFRFHGCLPSQIKRGAPAKIFPPLSLNHLGGNKAMNCTIELRPSKILTGFKRRFHGVPYGQERLEQENEFYTTTRGKQWLLCGASSDYTTQYAVVTNLGDDGYDFYIAYELDEWTRKVLLDSSVTGMKITDLGISEIKLPERLCAVFPTQKSKTPISEYTDIRRRIVTEWLPSSDYRLIDAPEVVELHWRMGESGGKSNRFLEITLPVERK